MNPKNYPEENSGWFTLPLDKQYVIEKLGLDIAVEVVTIYDHTAPFELSEHMTFDEINHLNSLYSEMSLCFPDNVIRELVDYWGSLNEVYQRMDQLTLYHAMDIKSAAYKYIDDLGGLESMKRWQLQLYFNYDQFADSLEANGIFIKVPGGYVSVAE